MENYLKACSLCVKKKNHKFMLERIEDILEILDEILINEILDDISENIPNYTINLLEEGKTIQEISILYAKDIINTELPSLKSLYTKGNYEYIVENVSEACIIDEETLIDFDINIETIKKNVNKNKELEKEIVDREKEEKYIKELFEGKEVESNNNRFTQILTNYIIYNKKDINIANKINNAIHNWYIEEIINKKDIKKIDFLIELVENTNVKLDNMKSFFDNTFKYIENKYQIDNKQLIQLQMEAYSSLKNGKLGMDNNPKLKKLLNLPILELKEDKVYFIFKSIHIYLAIKELIKQKENIFTLIIRILRYKRKWRSFRRYSKYFFNIWINRQKQF